MKVKTVEATGRQLDWGLSKALGHEKTYVSIGGVDINGYDTKKGWMLVKHTDPAFCIFLIEQYKPDVVYRAKQWGVDFAHNNNQFWSTSLAQAVARCVIDLKLGDEFECPDELEGV